MTIAGPLANLVSGFFLLVLPVHKSLIFGSFIGFSFFFGLANLVPSRSFGMASDGLQLLLLLWKRAKYEQRLALATIGEHLEQGMTLDQIPSDLMTAAVAVQDKSLQTVVAYTIAYAQAYNQQRDGDAARLLETCLRYSGYGTSFLREGCIANAGIFQAAKRKRVDLAKQWLADLPSNLEVPYHRLMIEGSILEAQQDYLGALEKVNEAKRMILAAAKPTRHAAVAPLEKWTGELEEKAKSSATSLVSPSTD